MKQNRQTGERKKKPEVKTPEDVKLLPVEERAKWEIAQELGLFDRVVENGWKSLTGRESGRIGGIISSRKKALSQKQENTLKNQ